MLRVNVVGDVPQINSTSFVDPSAIIIVNVIIGNNCYIGPSVVIRADRFSVDDEVTKIEKIDIEKTKNENIKQLEVALYFPLAERIKDKIKGIIEES